MTPDICEKKTYACKIQTVEAYQITEKLDELKSFDPDKIAASIKEDTLCKPKKS
jgi:hypothetical protein